MARDQLVPLPELAPVIRREFGRAPTYSRLLDLVKDRIISAERRRGRIWTGLASPRRSPQHAMPPRNRPRTPDVCG